MPKARSALGKQNYNNTFLYKHLEIDWYLITKNNTFVGILLLKVIQNYYKLIFFHFSFSKSLKI